MLYDGDCAFCERWIRRFKKLTGDTVEYFPYQECLERFPEIKEENCEEAVQLIIPNKKVLSGAEAVFRCLAFGSRFKGLIKIYKKYPLFAKTSDAAYRWVAKNRSYLSRF